MSSNSDSGRSSPSLPAMAGRWDDGVRRAAHGHQHADGVLERLARHDLLGRDVLLDQVDDAPPALFRQPHAVRVHRRNRRETGEHHAHRLGERRHGARRAHHHAGARGWEERPLNLLEPVVVVVARPVFGPGSAAVRTRAQHLVLEASADHRTRRHADGGNPRAGRAHELRGQGLVAAAEQHHAVHGLALDHLLGVHREEVPEEHGRGVQVHLAQGDGGEFQRQAARLPDAALHGLGDLPQMAMAGVEFAPGLGDADDGFFQVLFRQPEPPRVGASRENAEARVAIARQSSQVSPHLGIISPRYGFCGVHPHHSSWAGNRQARQGSSFSAASPRAPNRVN